MGCCQNGGLFVASNPKNIEGLSQKIEEELQQKTLTPVVAIEPPVELPKKKNSKAFVSKTIAAIDPKDSKMNRCKSDLKNQETVDINLLKLDTKVENALAVKKKPNSPVTIVPQKEELFTHQASYLGEVPIAEEIQKILSMKENSISVSPDQPLIEDKVEADKMKLEKISSKKNFSPLLSDVEKDHALNEKSKQKFNPEIFVHLKTGTINGNYKIGQMLGEGAYGKVNLVTHKTTNIVRALKTIKKDAIPKEDEKKLLSEMNILKCLDHPNIVKLIELYQDDQHYYLITEYCCGGELFERLKTMEQFSEKKAADIMKQILSALVYLNAQKIVHRDLKPENIIFESKQDDSNLKIIDFGCARRYELGKKMTKKLGTPYYIAPEVLTKEYDEKCDVWSCGVILFILLCGYPPFFGRTQDEVLRKVQEGKIAFDENDWSGVSLDAKNLIKGMLTKDPTKRMSSNEALNNRWIQKNAPLTPLNEKCMSNLSSFHGRTKLNTAILTFIATQVLGHKDKEEIRKTFQSLDKDGNGFLSKKELIEGFTKIYKDVAKATKEVEKIIQELDCGNMGQIDYTQFIIASMNQDKVLSSTKIQQAFRIFDTNGDGSISKKELENIMGGSAIPENTWKHILNQCDLNADGEISYAEFVNILILKMNEPGTPNNKSPKNKPNIDVKIPDKRKSDLKNKKK